MKECFEYLLNNYLLDNDRHVDSTKEYYHKFVEGARDFVKKIINDNNCIVKGSCGNGNKASIPWLGIFNKKITKSATSGIYICYLFRSDMSGFYLTLCQGITTFENLFKRDKYKYAEKVADYFKQLIDDNNFSKESIDLKDDAPLARGYEKTTVLSKYYEKGNYTEEQLEKDLLSIKRIYDDICLNLMDVTYYDVIDNVVNNLEPKTIGSYEASKMIENAIEDMNDEEKIDARFLERVEIPSVGKNKYKEITKKKKSKVDYVKKSKKNVDIGLLGESFVLDYEERRLKGLGVSNAKEKVKWVSENDDSLGYDVISCNLNDKGEEEKIYIEVKATEGSATNDFFISSNEIERFNQYRDNYYIYRVFKVRDEKPKVYILTYSDFQERIELKVENYRAILR